MRTLILIPARAGSKGLPGKNVKNLGGKPLICYTFDFAKRISTKEDLICVSTDDKNVIDLALQHDIEVPFKRPEYLSSDTASMYDVIMHTIDHYSNAGYNFQRVLLLQPTSPLRDLDDYKKLISEFDEECDMVVSVALSKYNPYFNLFEENKGFLQMSKPSNYKSRQECPEAYAYNGSMYLIRLASLKSSNLAGFKKIRKVIMPEERSVDIDTIRDWIVCEAIMSDIGEIKDGI